MTEIRGLYWPDDVGHRWEHALMHVQSLEWSVRHCSQKRTAVQAGGNVGVWPRRLAQDFARVLTFEPDAVSRECLLRNVPATVEVRAEALGQRSGVCGWKHKSLGGHRVVDGADVPVLALDDLGLTDLDLLQLDIEGYEWHALMGGIETIVRCRPLIQVELRNMSTRYGQSDDAVRALLTSVGYVLASRQQGSDYVYRWRAA